MNYASTEKRNEALEERDHARAMLMDLEVLCSKLERENERLRSALESKAA